MNQKVKSKRDFPYVTLILIVTLVLVVAILGYTFVDSVGIIGRMDNAAKSNNIKINEKELDVYRFHVAQNQYYTEFMYYQYGLMQDTYGITKMFASGAEYANYMIPSTVGSGTFDASAYAYAEQYLAYCEGAKEAGLYDEYKTKVESDINEYIDSLKETAKVNGVSFSNYLKNWIGKGMTEQTVRSAMEYYFIAGEYAEKLHEDYSDATTMEEIEKYRDENKSTFYSTAYTSYKLVSSALKDKYGLEECKTAKDVKIAIVKYYVDTKFDALYKTNITDKKIETTETAEQTKADVLTTILVLNDLAEKDTKAVFSATDTDTYKKAAYTICSNINTTAKTELNKVTGSSSTWSDPTASNATDLVKWLFGEGRKEGDTKLIPTTTTSKDSTTGKETTVTTYTWYVVGEVMKLDTERTKNAYYVFVTDDASTVENGKTAAEKAEAFATELKAAKTPEKFAELVEKYAPGYSAEISERISHESMKSSSQEFADWLYAEGRAKGDITTVAVKDSTNSTKTTGYVVAMYEDENEETWKLTARDALAEEKLTAWFEAAVEKYNVEIDYEPETTAATTTTATTTTAHDHDHDHEETTTAPETTVAEETTVEPETTAADAE
ncbi:MAG: hypothetical protein IKM33_07215 [Clostridia bacterium]|nr:hypothetical protein [Clostridia bacterium]